MNRVEGWQIKFRAVIAQWIDKEFIWGKTDCFCFAGACIEAITGKNPLDPVSGKWNSKREAYKCILSGIEGRNGKFYKADNLSGYINLVGFKEKPVSLAQRGDIVLCDVEGTDCTGIMAEDGKKVWVMCSPAGMALVPITAGVKAWGV